MREPPLIRRIRAKHGAHPGVVGSPEEMGELIEGARAESSGPRGLAGLGYVGAWRVCDSQHFGVAQRRKRGYRVLRAATQRRVVVEVGEVDE